jgi:hypothetical protein
MLTPGTQYWVVVRNYQNTSCNAASSSFTFTTVSPNTTAWWQVMSGDVHAGDAIGGVVKSIIPTGVPERVLVRNNTAGYSGVVSAGTSGSQAIDLGVNGGTASNPADWRAVGSPFMNTEEGFSYNYFERKIPDGCVPTPLSGSSIPASGLTTGGQPGVR